MIILYGIAGPDLLIVKWGRIRYNMENSIVRRRKPGKRCFREFYEEMVGFICSLFESVLKRNDYV